MPSVHVSQVFDDLDPTQQTASQEDAAKLAETIVEIAQRPNSPGPVNDDNITDDEVTEELEAVKSQQPGHERWQRRRWQSWQ